MSRASCPRTLGEYAEASPSSRAAFRAFLLTSAYASFWGSNDHLLKLIQRVHSILPVRRNASLLDVGAGQYNTVGGDISHALLYARLWGCDEVHSIIGFEPTPKVFLKLSRTAEEETASSGPRPCLSLRQMAVSHSNGTGGMAPQPGAGSNTASLDTHFGRSEQPRLPVHMTTIDDEIAASRRDGREAQVCRLSG